MIISSKSLERDADGASDISNPLLLGSPHPLQVQEGDEFCTACDIVISVNLRYFPLPDSHLNNLSIHQPIDGCHINCIIGDYYHGKIDCPTLYIIHGLVSPRDKKGEPTQDSRLIFCSGNQEHLV